MALIRKTREGKPQIIKDEAFCQLLDQKLPPLGNKFTDLFDEFDKTIRREDSRIKGGALSNSHGDWYEWLLALASWNIFVRGSSKNLGILLPNISSLDVSQLYESDLSDLIRDLRKKVSDNAKVEFISSNPDFVIIKRDLALNLLGEISSIKKVNISSLDFLRSVYKSFVGRCSFNDILGYISVKTSFRPDRRLQIPHEGSLMKALYVHLQTRKWIINPAGLNYYAIATEVKTPDRKALKTVATHSITSVHSIPQAAVDEVYQVNSFKQAQESLSEIL